MVAEGEASVWLSTALTRAQTLTVYSGWNKKCPLYAHIFEHLVPSW